MNMDIMVDLETMATTGRDIAIVSIGAVAFDPKGHEVAADGPDTFYANISLQSCIDAGLRVDGSTVMWWLGQSDEARGALLNPPAVDLDEALFLFKQWVEGRVPGFKGPKVWSHGSSFDIAILEALYGRSRYKAPWFFSNARDTRTLFELGGYKQSSTDTRKGGHNALSDAIHQASGVQLCLKRLAPLPVPV